jgi:hypothetical protein
VARERTNKQLNSHEVPEQVLPQRHRDNITSRITIFSGILIQVSYGHGKSDFFRIQSEHSKFHSFFSFVLMVEIRSILA